MKSQISPQDYEQLSAFLDGELKGAAERAFQERIEKDPDLKAALHDLRNMRALVRAMPRRRAPRSFTLSPEMVKARKPGFFALAALRTVQFSAAVSGILLVLVLAGDLFLNRYTSRQTLAPAAAVEMAAPALSEADTNRLAIATAIATPSPAAELALDQASAPPATASAAGAMPAQAPLATGVPAAPKMVATEEMQALEAAPPGGIPPEAPQPAPLTATPELKIGATAASPIPPEVPETARPVTAAAPSPFLLSEVLLAVILVISIILAYLIRRSISRK